MYEAKVFFLSSHLLQILFNILPRIETNINYLLYKTISQTLDLLFFIVANTLDYLFVRQTNLTKQIQNISDVQEF